MEELVWQTLNDELNKVKEEKTNAVRAQEYEKAARLREREIELLEQLGTPIHGWTSEALIYQQQLRAEQWEELRKRLNK